MKNIFTFARQSKPNPEPQSIITTLSPPPHTAGTVVHTTHLHPKYTVPPVPHPRPYDHIAVLATQAALLIRPRLDGGQQTQGHVRIAYGKNGKVEEVQSDGEGTGIDWSTAAVVYGIVGILELFTRAASYLLLITSKADVGSVLDPRNAIYSVKNIAAIPLTPDRAQKLVAALAAKNSATARMSLIPTPSSDAPDILEVDVQKTTPVSEPEQRVKFADDLQVKVMTPGASDTQFIPGVLEAGRSASPISIHSALSSGSSTPTSETSSATIQLARTLSERLSFWNRVPARRATAVPSPLEVLNEAQQPDEAAVDGGMRSLDSPMHVEGAEKDELSDVLVSPAPAPISEEDKHKELEEKILRQTVKDFSKGEMYFAHDFDITRSLQHKQDLVSRTKRQSRLLEQLTSVDTESSATVGDEVDVLAEPSPTLPLWRRVDKQFWWNENLLRPFIDAGLHDYILPIIQGHFQVSSFRVPREPSLDESGDAAVVDYIIMSRRSRDRAGLRYQRRGVDDDAHVANFVETETITRTEREGLVNIFSYVQIRGSIPLFWTQSGYGLKPAPQLSPSQTRAQNLAALKRHFGHIVPVYGPSTIVNLAEQHGKESQITNAYREYIEEANPPDVKYCQYDFHVETKGMKYEKIQNLIADLERTFESQGYFWVSDQRILCRQNGVYRVNCIDCLDRTNVVQSAFARYVLNRQLLALVLFNPIEHNRSEIDVVFNDVWANNGDAISRAYAGTSALKGDFTRTGKRDISGMLNDGMNSLARMYASTFSDWFCQAVIDYVLGYRTLTVFSEFLDKLQSTDPRELIRLSKIRAEAIATSVSRVLQEGEGLLSGWTLLSPAEMNVKVVDKWEEKVMLLVCLVVFTHSYDYNLEKVKMYTRVPLGDIIEITKGPYILSPLQEASRDPEQNFGFTIRWLTSHAETRMTSYSIRNSPDMPPPPLSPSTFVSPPGVGMPLDSPSTSVIPSIQVKQGAPQSTVSAVAKPLALIRTSSRRSFVFGMPRLSAILQAQGQSAETPTAFASFKALPVDSARARRGEAADECAGAANCKEAVAYMVDAIRNACADIGGAHGLDGEEASFVKEADIVGLAEAQRMTSVYAKMEYGLKRLLWLGG
ncbi:SacI homology domain-containing protein [Vararia minispora EC-137]|uniref:SacI homology domain-containing protein n=1 Tax=Vararia minispora EC-137 TaxID=1314806 RepID=A0ACB8QLL9_9AGAM|nr:SacI homology domain-containing protein [Vararia minispora EC-137]